MPRPRTRRAPTARPCSGAAPRSRTARFGARSRSCDRPGTPRPPSRPAPPHRAPLHATAGSHPRPRRRPLGRGGRRSGPPPPRTRRIPPVPGVLPGTGPGSPPPPRRPSEATRHRARPRRGAPRFAPRPRTSIRRDHGSAPWRRRHRPPGARPYTLRGPEAARGQGAEIASYRPDAYQPRSGSFDPPGGNAETARGFPTRLVHAAHLARERSSDAQVRSAGRSEPPTPPARAARRTAQRRH